MWTGSLRYVNGWRPLNLTIGIAGFELGKALSRTVKKASRTQEEQIVRRFKFDLDAYRSLFSSKERKIVLFDGHYTLRLPFTREPFQKTDVNDGNQYLTAKPRHWTNLNLGFLVTDGIGLVVQYKYGSLPPTFEFVDHQVTVGFNLLLKKK